MKAENILFEMVKIFPGLLDGETEVNGADLVEYLTSTFDRLGPVELAKLFITDAFVPKR